MTDARAKITLGLQVRKIKRLDQKTCARCDRNLSIFLYKGQPLVFRKTRTSFLCVKCVISKAPGSEKPRCTIEDLDRFLCSILGD